LVQFLIQQSFIMESTRRSGSETLNNTRATPYPKMPPSEAVNAYGVSSMGPTVESGSLSGNRPRHHQKGEKNYIHKLDQQGKA
jgi:hypothetical protein